MSIKTVLDVQEIAQYPENSERGVRIKTNTGHIVARVCEKMDISVGDSITVNSLVDIENSGDFYARELQIN
tara:strand:- start:4883 stop:5095 length:213 start_codon:yes stop_codon:yes gene_type:complete